MALDYNERLLIQDLFDVYDLVELLDLGVEDLLDAFEERIESNVDIMTKLGYG